MSGNTGGGAFPGGNSLPELARVVDALQQMIRLQGISYEQLVALVAATGTVTAATFAALDLSGLPTSDPGGGKPWLNGGVLQVGP